MRRWWAASWSLCIYYLRLRLKFMASLLSASLILLLNKLATLIAAFSTKLKVPEEEDVDEEYVLFKIREEKVGVVQIGVYVLYFISA